MKNKFLVMCFLIVAFVIPTFAQTHISVPLDNQIYFVLENAQMRGLCEPLSGAKPYSEQVVLIAIDQILATDDEAVLNGKLVLSPAERSILIGTKKSFERNEGWSWKTGSVYSTQNFGDFKTTLDLGFSWRSYGAVSDSPRDLATDHFGTVYVSGDMGKNLSYDFRVSAGALKLDRSIFQEAGVASDYPHSDTDFDNDGIPDVDVFDVTAAFPYTFTRMWDGSIYTLSNLAVYNSWPSGISFGYNIISELDYETWNNRLSLRFGRMRREYGAMAQGSSLILNAQARPFLGVEATFRPMDWFELSSITGVLEYINRTGIKGEGVKGSAQNKQVAYTNTMLEFRCKDYFHFDFGSTVIWPKRFELGYIFPVNSDFFYQNNIGDFDNLGLFANGFVQWPGVGKLWASIFVDEFNLTSSPFFNLDRNMYAFQCGTQLSFPWLPFGTITAKYTKIEPYCYTHPFTETPYSSVDSDTDYTNNGEPLGYYLKPNSDEVCIRFETIPQPKVRAHGQYQLIRHGADYGYLGVDGSSYESSMNYSSLNATKFFLRDGAYQWMHVIKAGGSYELSAFNIPVSVFGEAGIVYSYFTRPSDSDSGTGDYKKFSDNIYPTVKRIILALGFVIYP